ncbi:Crp/Fnr family transcriptional regulator [Hyphomicrobium denitrificans 1NES1]|uniref:Crp/Fnr family transcriptional regulator n=1 Tax=Hyphomicrobium denitrificans 1NES1 TaxID=670307 RepID=N0B4U1_9HYPH|nr:Crp/Fnr family transcriptional regulator [Hyphomicrobium denitrificans 1NES1]
MVIEDIGSPVLAPVSASQGLAPSAPLRTLQRNEMLFEAGDLKTHLYRIETGAICIYVTHPNKTREIIEFALAGDLVGMGFLERHATSARAVIDTKVSCLGLDEIDRLTAEDASAKARLDDAVEREFAFRRDYVTDVGASRPVVRLAAFLIAVSHQNENEGRDPAVIDDTLECAVVAGYLGVSVGCLAEMLVELEDLGLIQPAPHHGMRIMNMERLEALADEIADPLLQSDLPDKQRLLPGS